VPDSYCYLPYSETGYFSRLVTDYLSNTQDIRPFFNYSHDIEGVKKAIEDRQNYPVDRTLLVSALRGQYAGMALHPNAEANLEALADDNTFTICTAHQPNLLTGYLYFIYKILHAISMADELNRQMPGKRFVPVYYMGSEDNDLEELGTFRFRGDKYVWDGGGQQGAVGRMDTATLKPLLASLFKTFGPPGETCDHLQEMISNAYLAHNTIGKATQYLVNELFGKYGLLILDPDSAALKKQFVPVMEDELLNSNAHRIIGAQIQQLGEHYKIQAHPREINLFYLAQGLRARIEKKGEQWHVVDTDIVWDKAQIVAELHAHPERFSPNVMLRGLFQETILPDVAFIGGGAEVAYWMQLKSLFLHYKGFLPVIFLRQSALWVSTRAEKKRKELQLSVTDLFQDEHSLISRYVTEHSSADIRLNPDVEALEKVLNNMKEKATNVDTTLTLSAEAVLARMRKQASTLQHKMLRAEKRKQNVQVERISSLKKELFPGDNLQERVENFAEYYLQYGERFFDALLEGIKPFFEQFLVVNE